MKISTRGRYAMRMLADIAEYGQEGPVSLDAVSRRQDISRKYLEQIVLRLTAADLIRGSRGPQGGYRLSRSAETITLEEILTAAEGSLSPVACMDDSPNRCDRCSICRTLPVWEGLDRTVREYLSGITLKDLIEQGSRAKEAENTKA